MKVGHLTIKELLALQKAINAYFVRRRDRAFPTGIIYARLKTVEGELSKRRMVWR